MGALSTILIVAYLLIVLALIAVILLQRSEGGGLGMGTSSNNGLISVRGSANLLTRTTAILAALFFATAVGLTILSKLERPTDSILDGVVQDGTEQSTTVGEALKKLQDQNTSDLPVPTPAAPTTDTTTPAAPATDSSLPAPAATDTAPAATDTAPAATDTAPAATDAAPAATDTTTPAATTPAAPADSTAPAATTPAAPATTDQPAAPAN
jgi:preprotein translocase subunit SecG